MANETGSSLSGEYQEGKNEDEISLLDLFLILASGKKLIISLTLICGLAAGIVAFVVPKTYMATATILSPQPQSSSAIAMMGQLGGLAGLAGQSLGIKDPADTYIGILESRTIADTMIVQFKLQELYRTKTLIATRKKLAQKASFMAADSGLIEISVEDREPQRAADMANAYVAHLQEQNSRLAVSEASQRRLFFERQLEDEKNKLAEAEGEFKIFQEQRGAFHVDSQMEAVMQSTIKLRTEITAGEVNLERLKAGGTAQNPKVLQQEAVLKRLHSELRQLEEKNSARNQDDPLLPTSMMPEVGLEYARKLREVKYHEALYEFMAQQYETARIDEARESPVIQMVDVAVPPDWKSAPKRSLYILAGLFLGGMMGVFIVFLRHAVNDSSQADKMVELRNLLSFRTGKQK